MSLPVYVAPVHTLIIPSTKAEFKYRPFLVREQKTLLEAQMISDMGVMVDTIKDLISSCAKSPIDVTKLTSFDLEYIFLQLRINSVSEKSVIKLQCQNNGCEDNPSAATYVSINLNEVQVQFSDNNEKKIDLYDKVGVVMKYPNADTIKKATRDSLSDTDLIVDCIDYIYDDSNVYGASDHTTQQLTEFVLSLPTVAYSKIQAYFETLPQLSLTVPFTCPVCGLNRDTVLSGLGDFL